MAARSDVSVFGLELFFGSYSYRFRVFNGAAGIEKLQVEFSYKVEISKGSGARIGGFARASATSLE